MGSPPPPDAPPVAQQATSQANAGFAAGPPIGQICGFTVPGFTFKLLPSLPPISFPPPIPTFSLSIGLNCSLSNPLNISAGLAYGGGRVSNADPDPDLQLDQATS